MATAVPWHFTLLIDKYLMISSPVDSLPSRVYFLDRCVDALENLRSTPNAVAGYSAALAALIGGVSSSPLAMPHNEARGEIVFDTAEELLRSASQNNRLDTQRTQAGWLLIGAVMTLGNDCSNYFRVRYLIRNLFQVFRWSAVSCPECCCSGGSSWSAFIHLQLPASLSPVSKWSGPYEEIDGTTGRCCFDVDQVILTFSRTFGAFQQLFVFWSSF